MFNPLQPFTINYLSAFIKKGVVAFVKQSYQRGRKIMDPLSPPAFVLIHFEKPLAAQQYFDVLKEDPARELLYINSNADMNRLTELIGTGNCFMMLKIKDAESRARKLIDKKLKLFIDQRLNWHPSRNDEVKFSLDVQFGEVYARLKFKSKEIKVKLVEIEKITG